MQHLQPLDLARASRAGKRLVGRDAVGIARVALVLRHLDRMQVGEQAGLGQMIVIGVPVEADLGGADLGFLLVHIADDEDLVVIGQAVVPQRMQVGPAAEAVGEGEIVRGRELLLAAEQQQRALHAGCAHDRDHLGVVLVAEVDAVDPRADMLGKIGDLEAARWRGRAPVELLHRSLLRGTVIARH